MREVIPPPTPPLNKTPLAWKRAKNWLMHDIEQLIGWKKNLHHQSATIITPVTYRSGRAMEIQRDQ